MAIPVPPGGNSGSGSGSNPSSNGGSNSDGPPGFRVERKDFVHIWKGEPRVDFGAKNAVEVKVTRAFSNDTHGLQSAVAGGCCCALLIAAVMYVRFRRQQHSVEEAVPTVTVQ